MAPEKVYKKGYKLIIIFCVFDVSRIWYRACKDQIRL